MTGRNMRALIICAILVAVALVVLAPGAAHAQGPNGGNPPAGTAMTGTCWQCHRQPNTAGPNGVAAANALCQDCHSKTDTVRTVNGQPIPLEVKSTDFGKTRHSTVACIDCHTTVARSPHVEMEATGCTDCHNNLATHLALGDAHLNVECAACHFQADAVTQDKTTNHIIVARVNSLNKPVARTNHTLVSDVPCERCHTAGNTVRAPAAALPPKDVTCIGCHAAVPTVGSPVSLIALVIFVIGLAFSVSVWLGGNIAGRIGLTTMEKLSVIAEGFVRIVFSRRLFTVLWTGFVNGILHIRILKESVARWTAHSLILLPFFARFVLGVITWLAAQFYPNAPLTRVLVDRDAPAVAFTNDLLALLIVIGAGYAAYLRTTDKQRRALTAGQDMLALVLLGLIFVFGFVLEGAHIVVAQIPWDQAWYALGGAAFGALFSLIPLDWAIIYPVLFWVHALLVAVFVAYLPFSKFFHIIVSLFVVAIRPAIEPTLTHRKPAGEHAP